MSGLSLSSFVEVMVRDEDASTLVYRLIAVSQCAKGFVFDGGVFPAVGVYLPGDGVTVKARVISHARLDEVVPDFIQAVFGRSVELEFLEVGEAFGTAPSSVELITEGVVLGVGETVHPVVVDVLNEFSRREVSADSGRELVKAIRAVVSGVDERVACSGRYGDLCTSMRCGHGQEFLELCEWLGGGS